MIKLSFGLLILSVIVIAWCSHTPSIVTPTQDDLHAEDMDQKSDKTDSLSGEVTSTLELLQPTGNVISIVSEEVEYATGIIGYYSYPEDMPNAPGIVVIHEWRWLNEHIKDMTKVLAQNGYKALAVDLYKGEVGIDATWARQLSSSVNQEEATANLLAAEEWLRNTQEAPKVASLGRCFGWKQSLQLSLASDSLDSTIIYYGSLETNPEVLRDVNEPVLWIFAENDRWIPPSMVASFETGLEQVGVVHDITIYSGVDHAFANPTGGNYSKEATLDAWRKTLRFLEDTIKR